MSLPEILILHGPNLDRLSVRSKQHYGGIDFNDFYQSLKKKFTGNCHLYLIQQNSESDLIETLHQAHQKYLGVIINAGGLSHTSIALADAAACCQVPVMAIHISNTHIREAYRRRDLLAPACSGAIIGLGLEGYELAIDQLLDGHT